jgi:hypothetical protein
MRTEQDINSNQCDRCGKITKEGDLVCGYEDTEWEGLALCPKCQKLNEEEGKK